MGTAVRSSGTLATGALAVSLIAACMVVGLALAPPASAAVGIQVASVSQPMGNAAGTATNAVAQCPAGTVLVGGGIHLGRATDTATPGDGLKVNGTVPSDSGGNPVANGAADPSFWTAVGGFGAVSEPGDQVTAFAMCSTGGPAHTVVSVASVNAPTASGATATVTAGCPAGTGLVGGGHSGRHPGRPASSRPAAFPAPPVATCFRTAQQTPIRPPRSRSARPTPASTPRSSARTRRGRRSRAPSTPPRRPARERRCSTGASTPTTPRAP